MRRTGRLRTPLARIAGAALLLFLLMGSSGLAHSARPRVYAITGARIVVAPRRVIPTGVVVLRDGLIEAVGASVMAPADAEIVDGKGLTLYPGLIDPFTRLGMPRVPARVPGAEGAAARPAEKPSDRGPGRPNTQVRSDARAALLFQQPAAGDLEKYRKLGFTSALAVPDGGAFRGTSALIHLGAGEPGRVLVSADVGAHLAFETAPDEGYPDSLMGVIALIRQSFLDARRQTTWSERWRNDSRGLERPPVAPALEALEPILRGTRRVFFEADDTHAIGRIAAITREFSFTPIVVGSGYEYEVEAEVRASGFSLILPVAFPDPPTLINDDDALDVTTRELRRWDLAPGNPAAIRRAGIPFAFTTHRLRSPADFAKNVRKAIERGLPAEAALEAVTLAPARMLGVDTVLGTVEAGKIADIILTDGDLFAEKTRVRRIFIDGDPVDVEEESKDFDPNAKVDPRGTWEILYSLGGQTVTRTFTIAGAAGAYTGTGETQAGTVTLSGLALTGNKLTGAYTAGGATVTFEWILKGETLNGSSTLPNGTKVSFSGRRTAPAPGDGL